MHTFWYHYDYTGQDNNWVKGRVYYCSQELENTRRTDRDQRCAKIMHQMCPLKQARTYGAPGYETYFVSPIFVCTK